MKKIFVSIGLAAAGTASLHASIIDWSETKDWSIASTLRGFYDDNYLTASKKQGSLGFEVSPSFNLQVPMAQTELGIKYTYGLYYYQKREENHQNPIDQSHQFDLWIDHAFNSRWDLKLSDTVSVAQDPPLTAGPTPTAQRVSGNNVANSFNASLHTDWAREFSTTLSYGNNFVDYENTGAYTNSLPSVTPSFGGLLNRVEQSIGLEGQWHFSRTTSALLGYQFGLVNFTGNEVTAYITNSPAHFAHSSDRDNYSHYGYMGVQHSFLENLQGNAKIGVQYTKYYNDPSAQNSLGPYADMSLVYTYAAGSYAQVGFTETRNATDAIQQDSKGHITQDQESSVLYASLNHPLTPKLMGSILGHYQYSIYHEGEFNDQTAQFYNLGVNLTYNFTRHFTSELGYNFDYYTSAAGGNYSRNRIYLGLTASY
jgi:Putative beta-barrel porin 2